MQILLQHMERIQISREKREYIWLCFGYIQRIKEKCQVQVMFSGDGRKKRERGKESRETKGGR